MQTLLITGFEPFEDETLNPSWEVAKALNGKEYRNFKVVSKEIPTVFYESSTLLEEYLEDLKPSIVINLGQAGGSETIRIEKIAINLNHANIKDNRGNQPRFEVIKVDEPDGYFTSLPVNDLITALGHRQIPVSMSLSAGSYVCNHLFYHLMSYIKDSSTIGGFIHIPYIKEQISSRKNVFSMELNALIEAIDSVIETTVDYYLNTNELKF